MESEYFFNVGLRSSPVFEYFEPSASLSIPTSPPMHPLEEMRSLWDKSADQSYQFDSALTSLGSSPAASNVTKCKENFVIRELIGKLGSIEDEILLHSQPTMAAPFITAAGNTSANGSSYSTPLNSPAKIHLHPTKHKNLDISTMNKPHHFVELNSNLNEFSSDPGFAERAARLSCFGNRSINASPNQFSINSMDSQTTAKVVSSRVSGGPRKAVVAQKGCRSWDREIGSSFEAESTVYEQLKSPSDINSRKRKASPKGKAKETHPSQGNDEKFVTEETEKSHVKEEEETKESEGEKRSKSTPKSAEAPKDYIHVRARRGQATDSHSLAERVRREKISERMKLLQDLVPGCNKVTGKASMLDEIINYVQSLQRQVEFLSMKLASVNTKLEFNVDSLMNKNLLQANHQLSHSSFPLDIMASSLFGNQSLPNGYAFNGTVTQSPMEANESTLCQNFQLPEFPHTGEYSLCEGDLQSIVHMNFNQSSPSLLRNHNAKKVKKGDLVLMLVLMLVLTADSLNVGSMKMEL